MASMPNSTSQVNPPSTMSRVAIGGIDTHKDLHVAAVIDEVKHFADFGVSYGAPR